jgi:RNA polymerase sigma-70 factor, ECF subfamily
MSKSEQQAQGPVVPARLDRLLEDNLAGLKAFLRVRVGPAIRAQVSHSDLVQSVCREVLAQRDRLQFQSEAAFRKWLYTAALHKIIEQDRKQHAARRDVRREAAIDATDGIDADVLQSYATATTPSVIAMGREGAAKLEEAFDELSEEHREVITLARIVGLSHAEIAAHLGKNEDACRQLLRRALVKLSIALGNRGIQL